MSQTKIVFTLNCLCCQAEIEYDHLEQVQASEHLCHTCAKLPAKDYLFVLMVKKVKS